MKLRTYLVVLTMLPMHSWALDSPGEVLGLVSAVMTGDRALLRAERQTIAVRLAGIEAPAPNEPFWEESRESLRALCLGRAATLVETGTALDGSVLGSLSCDGVQINEEQVKRGMARATEHAQQLDSVLRDAQRSARAQRLGMWQGK
jgi:micrococcal nuclease